MAFLEEAFPLQEWQISGPSWLTDEKFELAAIMPEGTTKDVARLMLRRMLIERFGLRYHQVRKESPIYALVVPKNGSRRFWSRVVSLPQVIPADGPPRRRQWIFWSVD
jgi:uncharacterized protein (TIGR03435 family)